MATIQLPPDFKEFLRLLNSNSVKYLLIGGYAVNYHGYSRSTCDMDIWVARDVDNAGRICRVLQQFGFPNVRPELFTVPDQVVRMGLPLLRIEILTSISGLVFDDCYPRRIAAPTPELVLRPSRKKMILFLLGGVAFTSVGVAMIRAGEGFPAGLVTGFFGICSVVILL